MATSGDQYVDDGHLTLSFLTRTFDDELTAGALLGHLATAPGARARLGPGR
jgi:hypothetical protein